ncbi:ASKHA domain-containing protein [Clostridium sp. HMP27]|uniref:ASKHA domain-containing protein n=1 Tax=Clostridium sp. HMP27 TaxID=1487921 RepID=UPI00052CDD6C|nr:ASKHA domain-containing protein [Clostridium sp. HMP27]KGK85993.1 hypothetical protein DP68_14250 [Clostridium sp. HMP27]
MSNIYSLNFRCNKDVVMRCINCKKTSPLYSKVVDIYDEMLNRAKSLVNIKGSFKFVEGEQVEEYFKEYEYFVPCIVTLGEEIIKEISNLFKKNQCMKAIILDEIASQALFNATKEMFDFILKNADEEGLNLTPRLSPGDNSIPLEFQQAILSTFNQEGSLGVSLTEALMLNPIKSMTYYYGAGKDLERCTADHDCKGCGRMNCVYKKEELIKIKVIENDEVSEVYGKSGDNLLDILRKNDIFADSPCGGSGKCGKCKIKIIQGNCDYKENHEKRLSDEELKAGIRLACFTYLSEELKIQIINNMKNYNILTEYSNSLNSVNPKIEILTLNEISKDLKDGISMTELIDSEIGNKLKYSLKSLQNLAKVFNEPTINIVLQDDYVIDISSKHSMQSLGIAMDIGTSTIVLKVISLINGSEIGSYSVLNPQKQFGADVISRIQYDMIEQDGKLTKLIRKCIDSSIEKMCKDLFINYEDIHNIAVAANTTMLYFLLGINPKDLATSPFTTVVLDKQTYNYYEIFENSNIKCEVNILPCISAYIGADIFSGMMHKDFHNLDKTTLLIDIGTNGEMVIGNSEKNHCTSTAAGPAFEGANIINGVGSVDGAINKVYMKDKDICFETINNLPPIGICGSGVIDIISVLLENNMIDKTGRLTLENMKSSIPIAIKKNKAIDFYQRDIREVQLAKSAIRTGMDILISRFGCSYSEIDEVLVSGGFGNNINVQNAVKIGLIPKELKEKVKFIGNSSLGGAVKYLLNKDSDKMIDDIKAKTSFFDLGTIEEFNQKYIYNMYF